MPVTNAPGVLLMDFPGGAARVTLYGANGAPINSSNPNPVAIITPADLATTGKQDTGNTALATILTTLTSLLSRYTSTTATITTSPAIVIGSAVTVIAANANRKGLMIYNNSANTIYIAFGASANSGTTVTQIITTFTTFTMLSPIYTGAITATRNAGAGTAVITELT